VNATGQPHVLGFGTNALQFRALDDFPRIDFAPSGSILKEQSGGAMG
jgi:hypothetical protein